MGIDNLTWTAHETLDSITRAWYKGCSIVCDNTPDRKYLGALYEVKTSDGNVHKAHSLESVDKIICSDYEG